MHNEISESMIEAAWCGIIGDTAASQKTFLTVSIDRDDMRTALSAALAAADEQVPVATVAEGGGLVWHKFVNAPCDLHTSPPVASPEPADELLADAQSRVRQALVDAAHVYRADKAVSSAMFKAEIVACNAIGNLRAALSARPTPPCDGRAEALEARGMALEAENARVPTCKEEFLGDDIKRMIEIAELNGKADAFEDIANQHEEDAQEYNRLRDPGMANHHRKYARGYRDQAAAIRALTQKDKADE